MGSPNPPQAGLYDGVPDYVGPLGRDAEGYLTYRNRDQMDVRITECCHATAKGCDDGIACRKCYRLIDEAIGGMPLAPVIGEGGVITATRIIGWGDSEPGPPYSFKVCVDQLSAGDRPDERGQHTATINVCHSAAGAAIYHGCPECRNHLLHDGVNG